MIHSKFTRVCMPSYCLLSEFSLCLMPLVQSSAGFERGALSASDPCRLANAMVTSIARDYIASLLSV